MTRMFTRIAVAAAAIFVVSSAQAQLLGFRGKVGYHFSSEFGLRNGDSGSLQGPELGVDLPLQSILGFNLNLSPSIVLGGRLGSGSDVDGTVYRFMATLRRQLTNDGLYGVIGAGFGHTESRGSNEFRSTSAFISSLSVGMPIRSFIPGIGMTAEGTYYMSEKGQLRGITLGITASF